MQLTGLLFLVLGHESPPTMIQVHAADYPIPLGGQICFAIDSDTEWACAPQVEPLEIHGMLPGQHTLQIVLKDRAGLRVGEPQIKHFDAQSGPHSKHFDPSLSDAGIEFTAPSNGALLFEDSVEVHPSMNVEVHFSLRRFNVPQQGYIQFTTSGGSYNHRQPSMYLSMGVRLLGLV
jgi:hypothetical protein